MDHRSIINRLRPCRRLRKRFLLRLTNNNCSAALWAATGFAKPCSGLRPLHGFTHPHLGQGTFATQSPLTCPKRQLFRTLNEMPAKCIWIKKKVDNILIILYNFRCKINYCIRSKICF